MQDTLLRVFVVALSLLMYPMEDPRVEEWDDVTMEGMQEHEERLQMGRVKLDHEMGPANEEVTHTDNTGPQGDVKGISKGQNQSAPHVTEKDQMSVLQDVAVSQKDSEKHSIDHILEWAHFITNLDPPNSKSQPETALKTSQIGHEQMREGIQTDTSLRSPNRPRRDQEGPEKKEVFKSKEEEESPLTHLHTKTSKNVISEGATADWEKDYLGYMWNIFSIISMIQLFRKHLDRNSQVSQEEARRNPVPLPDSNTLHRFYSKCIQVSHDKRRRKGEFLERLANDLLDAMRTVCDRTGGVVIEDFQMVDVWNIIVPFRPSGPYSFQCLLRDNQASDTQVCGQIKLLENKNTVKTGCHCQSLGAEDTVCLLHCEAANAKIKLTDVFDDLCGKNSPFLTKSRVTRWFLSTVKQAWTLISHKYEFEMNIRYTEAPVALVVRFRSGRKICFSMKPVVKFTTDAHFFITPCSLNLDTFWTLSLTNYEDRLLERLSKRLPENSCHSHALEIALFLHKRQTALSGSCALKDFHFKTALMHLLLTTKPSQWRANNMARRLKDLLNFMEKSLEKKLLRHVLIGNPLLRRVIDLPAEFTQVKTVNLFHPLVVHSGIYISAAMHFKEMLRNAYMLIHDYVDPKGFI